MRLSDMKHYFLGMTCIAFSFIMAACGTGPSSTQTETGSSAAMSEVAATNDAASTSHVAPPSNLLNEGTLTLGVDASYPPLEYYDSQQKLQGFDIEIGEALAKEMGLNVKWVDTRFDGLIPGLNAGKFDAIVSGVTITPERTEVVDFIPYFSSGQSMIALKGSGLKIKDQFDIAGLRVAILSGSIQSVELNKTIIPKLKEEGKTVTVNTYPTNAQAIQQVLKGTADIEFLDSPVASEHTKNFPQLEIVSPDLNQMNRGIVTRKDDAEMGRAFQDAFQNLVESGTLDRLLKQYSLFPPK